MYHKNCIKNMKGSCGGSGYRLEDQISSVVPSWDKRFFILQKVPKELQGLPTHPHVPWVPGTHSAGEK
jgi:hypothetical protein